MTSKKMKELQAKVAKAQTASDTAKGRLGALYDRLEEEHGVTDLPAARVQLDKYTARRDAAQAKFETALEEFEDEYSETIAGLEKGSGKGTRSS